MTDSLFSFGAIFVDKSKENCTKEAIRKRAKRFTTVEQHLFGKIEPSTYCGLRVI